MIKHLYDIFAEKYYHGGEIFFYSDPHFGDLDCYKRRFGKHITEADVERYDLMQVENINKTVHKNDTIIFLGDVGDTKYIAKLKAGYKVLIMGNHDKGASNYKRVDEYIHKFEDEMLEEDAKYRWTMVDPTPAGCLYERVITNNLFNEVYEGNLYISDKIKLSHAPSPEVGYINLHGHDHAHNDGYCFAAEHIDYTPVRFRSIIDSGLLGKTTSFRRSTIDKAIERKAKRKSAV